MINWYSSIKISWRDRKLEAEFLWESKSTKDIGSSFWGKYQVPATISAIGNRMIRTRWNATKSDHSEMH